MIQLFNGRTWIEVPGPLTQEILRERMRVNMNPHDRDVLIRISDDLIETALAIPNFIPNSYYKFSDVGAELELGRVGRYIISTIEPAWVQEIVSR